MERVVFRANELDNILVLEKAIEIFKTFRNKLNDLLPIEKEKELGATFYVSKFIKSDNIKYGISYSDNYKL